MSIIGTISEFDVSKSSTWDLYVEQLNYFLEANSITDGAKKRATLLSVCGIKTLGILRSLVSPAKPSDKSYDDLLKLLKEHFNPRASEIYRRFQFHKRVQFKNETISEYVTDLRRLAEECNFGQTLSERLRDQFVCGLHEESIQRRLLAETELSFDDAIAKAYAAETAASQAKRMHSQGLSRYDKFSAETTDQIQHKFTNKNFRGSKIKTNKTVQNGTCYGCGGHHDRSECKFKTAKCHFCKRTGHIQKVCRAKGVQDPNKQMTSCSVNNRKKSHEVKNTLETEADYSINSITINSVMPKKENTLLIIEGQECKMEVDSGSFYSIISHDTYKKLWRSKKPIIHNCSVNLSDFQKNPIPIKGMCIVKVQHNGKIAQLRLIITESKCTSILGYEWFRPLGISLTGVNFIRSNPVDKVIEEFKDVFSEGLGSYKGPIVSLPIDPKSTPMRFKARNVPLAMRSKIEAALDKLLAEKVIEPISNPAWTTPVVPIIKPSGEVRLCGDYKVTLNNAMTAHPYPIPSVTHLLSSLQGGGYYAKIDLAQAYLQVKVDDKSAEAQTIITHKGAYKVKRLQYGINVAPGLFQNIIDELLADLPGVVPYFDDVLIRATSLDELAERLRLVLTRLREAGLRAKKEKCQFGVTEIEFLGYRVDVSGIHPSKSKIEAIKAAPIPKDKQQLQAFLGLLNFYHSFLKNKATIAEPLHKLLQNNTRWCWSNEHDIAFNAVKELLSSDNVLIPFDEKLPIVLICDASPYGIGSVLSHKLPDGREAPIAFSSRTLTSSERNYAQIDKEALSIISAVKKFHHFLFGHQFTIVTDHKPLLGLFNKAKQTPEIISPRMLRWSLILNAYDCTLVHRAGIKIKNADALSRLPRVIPDNDVPAPLEVLFTEELEDPPLHAFEIAKANLRDPILSRVLNWVLRGWPEDTPPGEFQNFYNKRHELSVHKNCLLWGNRVVIPKIQRNRVLEELHLSHPGIERMKGLARSYVWWPHIDDDISITVKSCAVCQATRHSPPHAPIHPWEMTSSTWSRLHIDFAGPYQGQNFLIIVDSFSKWIDVKHMTSTTAAATIDVLREVFSTHGIPDVVVSDNGGQFGSFEFRQFLKNNTIRQVFISPHRPAGNGQAERAVQTTKDSLKRIITGSWKKRLASFLLSQHITPSSTTGLSPAELLMGRRLTTYLDRLHPDLVKDIRLKQELFRNKQQEEHRLRSYDEREPVFIQNYSKGPKWIPATVIQKSGPMSYKAVTPSGDVVRRHIDQMRDRQPDTVNDQPDIPNSSPVSDPNSDVALPCNSDVALPCISDAETTNHPVPSSSADVPITPRRPKRDIVRPKRFDDYVTNIET